MAKIIKYGFRPISNTKNIRGQNDLKGKKLFESGHVLNVIEKKHLNDPVLITANVVAQTSVSKVYNVKLTLDNDRHVSHGECNCKAGLSGKCKHIFAVVNYINSPETTSSKTSVGQQWGKPSQRQLQQYQKGMKISEMFPPPLYRDNEFSDVEVCQVESLIFPDSLAGVPLQTMLNLENRSKKEIIAAESLVTLVKINEKINLETMVNKLVTDIVSLQSCNQIYSAGNSIAENVYNFYLSEVYCDVDKIIKISIQTLQQSKYDEWFKQRVLRITASNAHKLKGDRFDVAKVISDLLTPKKIETSAMAYGKKMENIALKEYEGLVSIPHQVIKVGLIVNMHQPWLSCSPDAVIEYGTDIWQKRLVEIKCPYKCKKIPVYDREKNTCNVQYLRCDENGLRLSERHSIYSQIQVQMYVTNIGFCDLFVYSPVGSVLITVARDNILLQRIIPKLERFYFSYYIGRLIKKFQE